MKAAILTLALIPTLSSMSRGGESLSEMMAESDLVIIGSCKGMHLPETDKTLKVPARYEPHIEVQVFEFLPTAVFKGDLKKAPSQLVLVEHYSMKGEEFKGSRRHPSIVRFRVGTQGIRGDDWVAAVKLDYLLFLRKLPFGRYALVGSFEDSSDSARIVSPVF